MIAREADLTKQESSTSDNAQNFNASTTTTSSWSRLKDPRIIRVSRAFGGKDRHSKVCTVRGLRDRRVRLSVPTAIQLYDLQDRLGLNQPSKVVDWLLNAAKREIDELPPLQFPQGSFNAANLLPMMNLSHQIRSPDHQSDKQGLRGKSKAGDGNWARSREEGSASNLGLINQDAYVSAENLSSSSRQNPSLLSSLMNTSSVNPINSFVRWDPSNLTLSQPPTSVSHGSDLHNFSLVYQPYGMSAHPYFHSQISASNAELFDSKNLTFQSSALATSSLNPPSLRPIHFNMTANLLPSQNNDAS